MTDTIWRPRRIVAALALATALLAGSLTPASAESRPTASATNASAAPAVAAKTAAAPALALAAAKPKITAQPTGDTVIAGRAAKFTVKATGSKLKYRWYKVVPGSKKWVQTPHTGSSVQLTVPRTEQNGLLLKVKVSNADGSVVSKIVRLTVLSTASDPIAVKRPTWLNKWAVSTVGSSGMPWTRIKRENRFNEPAPPNFKYILTRFEAFHRSSAKLDPAYTLDFKFIWKDKAYKAAVVITPDDLFDVGSISKEKTVTFTVAVAVPQTVTASGGSWEVTDFSDYKNRELGYFRY